MSILKESIELTFSMLLFINALLLIPQSIRIAKEKTAKGISFITFLGLLLIQFTILLYGITAYNLLLIGGSLANMVTIGSVIVLTLIYRTRKSSKDDKLDLEEILAQLPGHIYWKDRDCTFLGSNTSNWKDFGLKSLDDFIGKTDYDVFSMKEAEKLRANDLEVMRTGLPKITEEILTSIEGKSAFYLSHKIPLKNRKGCVVGILGVSIDVTVSKQETIDKLDMLENIISVMPGTVYWMDRDGVYLGCNDNEAKAVGLKSRKDIEGKRNVDLPGFLIPEVLDPVNEEVMQMGKTITLEEPALLQDGTQAIFLSSKAPLKNSRSKVTGLVGISIDITDKKEALRAKQALIDVAAQVSHDIRSPLAALNTVLRNLPTIPEDQRVLIRNAVTRINDIANNLLVEYRGETANSKTSEQTELLSGLLDTLLSEKKAQISNRRVELNLEIEPDAFALFTSVDSTHFKRVISNLLNNAIEAIEGTGKVTARLEKEAGSARIRLIDTGKGMPPAVLDKIKRGGTTHGKTSGTGIGISSAINFIEHCGGHFDMTSTEGQGTTVIVDVPTVMAPTWFQETLTFTPGNPVVVLDDDESIHAIWTSRCQPFLNDITLKHIHHSTTFRQYCATADLSHSFFLMDYELLGSDETGLDLIEALNLSDRAILVTSRYEEANVRERVKKLGVKIIPKNFSPYIPISLTQQQQLTEEQLADDQPALVFIDDDKTLTRAWEQAAEFADLSIKTFNRTADFRKVLLTLPKTTPIYIDSNLCEPISGEVFAKELYEQGRTELYLASGHPRGHFGDLPWIKDFVGKEPPF